MQSFVVESRMKVKGERFLNGKALSCARGGWTRLQISLVRFHSKFTSNSPAAASLGDGIPKFCLRLQHAEFGCQEVGLSLTFGGSF